MASRVSYSRTGACIGVIILIVGLILLLDQMGYVSAEYVFRFFWPAIFIFFGMEMATCRNNPYRRLIGILLAGINTLWPLLLIIWGVWVIARAFGHGEDWKMKFRGAINDKFRDATGSETPGDFADQLKTKIQDNINYRIHENIKSKMDSSWSNPGGTEPGKSAESSGFRDSGDAEFDHVAIFGGVKQRVSVKNFRGGRVLAICGGFDIDLTRADIDGQTAVIEANALMGGGEIRVPDTWVVEFRGIPLLGGYSDETHQTVTDSATAKRL